MAGIWRSTYALFLTVATVFTLAAAEPVQAKTTIEDEIKIGEKVAKDIEKQFPVTENKEWLADIERLGSLLTPHVNRKEIPYTFKILKEVVDGRHEVDAFSLPGGRVYFSERMWRLLTRDERLGVLAHEIAHVDKRHAIDTIGENQKRSIWAIAILIITGASGSWWDAADIANTLYTLKYSRKREREADMVAIELTQAAGESVVGLVTSLQKILRLEKASGRERPIRMLSTHPNTDIRVTYLTERALELGLKPQDLTPRYEDEPERIGDVVARRKEEKRKPPMVEITSSRPLTAGENVSIKKFLWDDASDSVKPVPVAKGVVEETGEKHAVSIVMQPGFEFIDIEEGDGVYPRAPDPVPPPPQLKDQQTPAPEHIH